MDPPTGAATKKRKENARKAAQKKAKKKAPSTSLRHNQSSSSPVAAPTPTFNVPSSYLSTFSASTTPILSPHTSTHLPAALLAEPVRPNDPGWLQSKKAAWAQAQKNVCIRWVRAKREKVAHAEQALAAGRGSDAQVEEATIELSEEIDDAIKRGCAMEELQ